jgi:hypothetical protein
MTLFDWVGQIIKTKSHPSKFNLDDWKNFNIFMIHRTLSMNPSYLEIVDNVQGLNLDDKEKIYNIYCNLIPRNNRTFFTYIKSQTRNPNKEALKYISDFYLCGLNEADEYLNIMGKDNFKLFLENYGLDKKEITKLLK